MKNREIVGEFMGIFMWIYMGFYIWIFVVHKGEIMEVNGGFKLIILITIGAFYGFWWKYQTYLEDDCRNIRKNVIVIVSYRL